MIKKQVAELLARRARSAAPVVYGAELGYRGAVHWVASNRETLDPERGWVSYSVWLVYRDPYGDWGQRLVGRMSVLGDQVNVWDRERLLYRFALDGRRG
jgi:hypothetical protein